MLIINWVIKTVNLLCALALAAVFLCSHFPPESLPYISVAGLLAPFLIIVNVFFALFWVIRLKPFALYSILALVVGWSQLGHAFALGGGEKVSEADTLRVVSYNVHGFSYKGKDADKESPAEKIAREVARYAPDVVCFQEYVRGKCDMSAYRYSYVQPHGGGNDAVFSKYPIVGTGNLDFPRTQNNAVYADIRLPEGRVVRVYSVHLQSLGISADEVNELTSLSSDQLKDRAKGLLGRLNTGFVRQQSQVEALRASIDASPYPCIVAGDFNNTPFSYAFLTIAGDDLTDAFSQAGFGFGRTFRAIKLYPLRIDFILADEQTFRPAKFSTLRSDASDHNGITALLTLIPADQQDKTPSEDEKP